MVRRARTDGKEAAIKAAPAAVVAESAKLNESDRPLKNSSSTRNPLTTASMHSLWHSTTVGDPHQENLQGQVQQVRHLCASEAHGAELPAPQEQAIQADEAKLEAWVNRDLSGDQGGCEKASPLIFLAGRDLAQARRELGPWVGSCRRDSRAADEWPSTVRPGRALGGHFESQGTPISSFKIQP